MAIARDNPVEGSASPAFNPLDPELWVDSHPILRRLRETDPVHVDGATGLCAVTGHDEVESVFRNPTATIVTSIFRSSGWAMTS